MWQLHLDSFPLHILLASSQSLQLPTYKHKNHSMNVIRNINSTENLKYTPYPNKWCPNKYKYRPLVMPEQVAHAQHQQPLIPDHRNSENHYICLNKMNEHPPEQCMLNKSICTEDHKKSHSGNFRSLFIRNPIQQCFTYCSLILPRKKDNG